MIKLAVNGNVFTEICEKYGFSFAKYFQNKVNEIIDEVIHHPSKESNTLDKVQIDAVKYMAEVLTDFNWDCNCTENCLNATLRKLLSCAEMVSEYERSITNMHNAA